ncbi:MAG: hypothetical protein JW726_14330 [Anaerolineales bacterium]|nr:hypothetical protein [Anaerolineales bacterium]
MEQALQFFQKYELWIYAVLILLGLWHLRKFGMAWEELRGAIFGMERENAQGRLNQAATMLVLVLLTGIAEFTLVTFVIPSVPGAMPLPSPTLDLLATATITLQPVTPAPGADTTPEPTGSSVPVVGQGCVPDTLILTSPEDGSTVSGVVTLEGSVNIANFGFYTYEVARPGETIWLPLQVGQQVVISGTLGTWDTSGLAPGPYQLRLVVTDNEGNILSPCIIQVNVAPAP